LSYSRKHSRPNALAGNKQRINYNRIRKTSAPFITVLLNAPRKRLDRLFPLKHGDGGTTMRATNMKLLATSVAENPRAPAGKHRVHPKPAEILFEVGIVVSIVLSLALLGVIVSA
jgi:hypothetical protein